MKVMKCATCRHNDTRIRKGKAIWWCALYKKACVDVDEANCFEE